jgi:hypothetical protein
MTSTQNNESYITSEFTELSEEQFANLDLDGQIDYLRQLLNINKEELSELQSEIKEINSDLKKLEKEKIASMPVTQANMEAKPVAKRGKKAKAAEQNLNNTNVVTFA